MNYQIGSTTITAEELADMKRTDIDCKFWIKRIQRARTNAILGAQMLLSQKILTQSKVSPLAEELTAIGVKIL